MNIKEVINILEENKAEEIQTFTCKGYICENVVIATTLNGVHSYALSGRILNYVKEYNESCIIDGDSKDGWVVVEIPALNTIVHLMVKEKRDYYKLEEILAKNLKK